MRISSLLAAAALLFTAPAALADQPAPATAVATTATATPAGAVDQGMREDPSLDHGFLLPTAMTQPKGSVTINDYDVVVLGVGYSPTDSIQLSATVAPVPFVGAVVVGSLKWQVLREGRFRMALQGGGGTTGLHLGAMLSACLRADCHSLLSANITALPTVSLDGAAPVIYGASWIQHLGYEAKVIVEVVSGASLDSSQYGVDQMDGALATAGLRLFGRHFAVDLGVMGRVGSAFTEGTVLPYLSASARF